MNYFVLLNFCFLWVSTANRVLYVNQKTGADEDECLQVAASSNNINDTNWEYTACKSLDFLSSQIGKDANRLTVVIESDLQLHGLISFANSTSLKITTDGKHRVLQSNSTVKSCGLQFYNITNLTISGIIVSQCEYEVNFVKMNRSVAVHVHQSTNLDITKIAISCITGTGLVLSDIEGFTVIEDSNFTNNTVTEKVSTNNVFAGGIHIQLSKNKVSEETTVIVKNCNFTNNTQPMSIPIDPKRSAVPDLNITYGYGTGGGMGVLFMDNTQGVHVCVDSCTFTGNMAYSGAGLYVHFQDNATNNSLTINSTCFKANIASAGGGMSAGIAKLRYIGKMVTSNMVTVLHTTFARNKARYGGGTSLFATHSTYFSSRRKQVIHFFNCAWIQNTAHYSPAIDISSFRFDHFNQGFMPLPKFEECDFIENQVSPGRKKKYTEYRSSGVIVITGFQVLFEGNIHFARNKYTALRLTSATVILEPATKMVFDSNEGIKGGAIAMYGFSALKGLEDCMVILHNNSATKVGGAMYYQPFEQREFIDAKSCFIQYIGATYSGTSPNFTFTFTNNTANLGGTAIFSVSFYACFFAHLGSLHKNKLSDFFEKIGHFQFHDSPDNSTALATEGNYFVLESNETSLPLTTPPGKPLYIPLTVKDEFDRLANTPIGLQVKLLQSHTQHQPEHSGYYYFTRNSTKLYGHSKDTLSLVFNTQNMREAYYSNISVNILDCPPGYHFDSDHHSCVCSADSKLTSYPGILACNASLFQAYIQREYWAGYYKNNLYTGPCAFQLCKINSNPDLQHLLPKERSVESLNRLMCGEFKKDFLCGNCENNTSAYFHSNTRKCGPKDKCNYSVLFYILSEIVPVIILFTLIIHFNISFTVGGVSGLIFFSQIVVTTPMDFDKILYNSTSITKSLFKSIQTGHTLIYNVLNFDFFSIDALSFCLWNSAKPMDVLAAKYVTTSFALVLIYILIFIMNSRWYMKWNKNKKPRSTVHGLSAFLILSFSQCASVTFGILGRNVITSNHDVDKRTIRVTKHGGLLYFKQEHMVYALPAIFFLIFLLIIPPLLLLLYPLLLQMLSLCNLSEHRMTRSLLKAGRIHRLIPLFDAFQSCYKDHLRFFAGLYFVYKLTILMCHLFTNNPGELFAATEGLIFLILGIHATAQPYKEKIHNIIDACVFFNLGVINGLNMYSNYLVSIPSPTSSLTVILLCALQMVLIWIPIIIVILWCVNVIVKKRRRRQYQRLESLQALGDSENRNETAEHVHASSRTYTDIFQ